MDGPYRKKIRDVNPFDWPAERPALLRVDPERRSFSAQKGGTISRRTGQWDAKSIIEGIP